MNQKAKDAAMGRCAGAASRVAACVVAALAVFACTLFGGVSEAHADPTAHLEVFQKYQSDWSGLADTFEYCLEARDEDAPLPAETEAGDRLDAENGKFYFTIHRDDHADTPASPARQLPITLDPESTWTHADRIAYKLYVVSAPEHDFGYHRYYDNAPEATDSSDLDEGTIEEQQQKMYDMTVYDVCLYPAESPADGDVFITVGNSQGQKVADAGWLIGFEGTEGTVHFLPNRSRGIRTQEAADEDALSAQESDEITQTWRLGETRNLRKNTFSNGSYRFTGWNTQPDGSGTSYGDEASYYMTPQGLTLYAQWAEDPARAGAGSGGAGSAAGQDGSADTPPSGSSNVLASAVQSLFPKTGDVEATAIAVVVLACLAAVAGFAAVFAWRRRRGSEALEGAGDE